MINASVTYKSYFIGLGLSIALTLLAYFIVTQNLLSCTRSTYVMIAILAVIQLIVQIVYFLHINSEGKPRWNLTSFVFTLIIVFIIVAGSLWVMHNLNTNMM